MSGVIDQKPIISIITEIEDLSWINLDKSKEIIVQEFIKNTTVLPLTSLIVNRRKAIRCSKKIKTDNSILAATAIIHDLIIITNDNDFENINRLKTLNPIKM
jgi:predicted nucleic acid-binding protein